jgi:hypothetical protein
MLNSSCVCLLLGSLMGAHSCCGCGADPEGASGGASSVCLFASSWSPSSLSWPPFASETLPAGDLDFLRCPCCCSGSCRGCFCGGECRKGPASTDCCALVPTVLVSWSGEGKKAGDEPGLPSSPSTAGVHAWPVPADLPDVSVVPTSTPPTACADGKEGGPDRFSGLLVGPKLPLLSALCPEPCCLWSISSMWPSTGDTCGDGSGPVPPSELLRVLVRRCCCCVQPGAAVRALSGVIPSPRFEAVPPGMTPAVPPRLGSDPESELRDDDRGTPDALTPGVGNAGDAPTAG